MRMTRKQIEKAQEAAVMGPKSPVTLTITVSERQLQHVLAHLKMIRIPCTVHPTPEKEHDGKA